MLEPSVFEDERGWFMESFHAQKFEQAIGIRPNFVQDNHSSSRRGVLRGLHFQTAPHEQGKLVRAVHGEIFDVAVDIRQGSSTFGQWVGEWLSAENNKQLWIPEGFAHGFLTLSETAQVLYKATNVYAPAHEQSIAWDDPEIGIQWPVVNEIILSEKDRLAPTMSESLLLSDRVE
jgi:dTDP-4-dehydrorhamnose 3,5-epimerase